MWYLQLTFVVMATKRSATLMRNATTSQGHIAAGARKVSMVTARLAQVKVENLCIAETQVVRDPSSVILVLLDLSVT